MSSGGAAGGRRKSRAAVSWVDDILDTQGEGVERGVLVHVTLGPEKNDPDEFKSLAESAGVEIAGELSARRHAPDARLFIGSGKAEELRALLIERDARLVLFDHDLSPSQEKNLERLLQARVLDRTGLILDIFAQRARSHEGKLQVELAQLRHISSRLVRGWSHLERQKGGIGLRGPGETQLETDRRLIGVRIQQILRRLEKVRCHREQGRRARRRGNTPTVSLVGYTNAGKSTLFNTLSGAGVYAEDQLFATLDPTLRRLDLGDAGAVVLADTVGFVRNLPHDLVAAFQATLEETREADLLLHVVDLSDPQWRDRREQVQAVLAGIGADEVPMIEVYNKIDACAGIEPRVDWDEKGRPIALWLSAREPSAAELVREALAAHFAGRLRRLKVALPCTAGRARADLYRRQMVRAEEVDEQGRWLLSLELRERADRRLIPPEAEILNETPDKE